MSEAQFIMKRSLESVGLPSLLGTRQKCMKRVELSFSSLVLGKLENIQLSERKKFEIKAVCITLSKFNLQSFANCLYYIDESLERQVSELHSIEINTTEAFKAIGNSTRKLTKVRFDDYGRVELLGIEEFKLHRFEDLPLIIHDKGNVTSSFIDKALESLNMIIRFDYHARSININYVKERLSGGFVCEFGSNLIHCLEYFYSYPNKQVSSFSLCIYHSVEKNKNPQNESFQGASSLKSLFETSVEKFPERIALEFEQESWTYKELNYWANNIVERSFLSNLNSEPVGIYSNNPCNVIAAILAIVKSGNTYVPMDPRYPDDRVVSSLRRAGVARVFCDPHYSELFDISGFESFTRLQERKSQTNLDNPSSCISIDSPAYILFTSGSTGKPKGVAVSHRNVVRLISVCQEEFQFNQNDRWTVFHSFCFDFSVWEMWGALAFGGTVLPVKFSLSRDPKSFRLFLEEKRVSILNQTPSAFKQLLPKFLKGDKKRLACLRHIIFGGEALETGVVSQWFKNDLGALLGCQLTNMFGITETTVHVTIKRLTKSDAGERTISLGKPLSDLKVILLSEEGSIVPEGAIGEILVSGPGVSLGYVSQPEETSLRFPSLDIVGDTVERYYRSGDLARFLPNGELEYLGRKDSQVQVRGFRIELEEIEKALLSIPEVSVAVVTHSLFNKDLRLLLAFICRDNAGLTAKDYLKQQLSKTLPSFMIPHHIFDVEEIPTTINGKVDTASLERFAKTQLMNEDSCESTYLNKSLEIVLQHCKDVLKSQAISSEYGFFDLGGDSMMGVELVAKLEEVGISIPLEELLKNTPLKTLKLSTLSATRKEDKKQNGDKFPATQLQLGMIYQSELSSNERLYHDVFHYSIEGEGLFKQVFERLPLLILQNPVLRTVFDFSDPSNIQQVVLQELDAPINYLDLRYFSIERNKQTLKEVLQEELAWKVDFQKSPLFRISLLQLTDCEFELILSVHHVILDGWSLSTFVGMLVGDFYPKKNELNYKVDIQPMKEFVQLEQEALNDASIAKRWKQLSSDLLESAGQFQRGPLGTIKKYSNSVTARSYLSRKIKLELVGKLDDIAKQRGLSLKSLFLAAHAYSLATIYDADLISTGLITNARPIIPGVREALGLFLNTVPLKVNVAVTSWMALAQAVAEAEQEMFPLRRYPLAAILRDADCSSLFCSAFNFVDFRSYDSFFKKTNNKITQQFFYERTDIKFLVYAGRLTVDQEWQLRIDFSTSEFPVEVAELFSELFFYALKKFIKDPDSKPGYPQSFGSISLNLFESQRTLVEPNNNASNWMLKRIAELVHSKPEEIAIIDSGKSLTYQELSILSSNYAQKIRTYFQDRSPTLVAIELDRSIDCVAAYLGCLKAGAICVPINPDLPSERKNFILKNSGATIFIIDAAGRNRSGHYEVLPIIDPNEVSLSKEPDFVSSQTTEYLYLLYTSGSTGKPKGVLFPLEQFEKLIKWQVEKILASGSNKSRLLHVATIGFDVSFQEIFTSLCLGSQLYVGSGELRDDSKALRLFIEKKEITHTFLPPSLFQQLARITTRDGKLLPCLNQIICAGECLLLNEITCKFLEENPNVELYNQYGPTETHVVTQHRVNFSEHRESGEVPIGLPLPHVHLSIRNRNDQPVPPFIPGEIVVEKLPLTQGYLTAKSTNSGFAYSKDSSSKLYRTGDRAYLDYQGNINFLGRIDQQVKVRGFRIELDEISNVLVSHPCIAEAVTIAKRGHDKTTNLISFIVNGGTQKLSEEEIARWLTQLLPHFMIPIRIHWINRLPLTSNGKVSRLQLSQLDEKLKLKSKVRNIESPSEMESIIISVWQKVIGRSDISKFDKFFELGGTSLELLEAYILLEERLGVKFEMIVLFRYVTPKELAAYFTDSDSSDSSSGNIVIEQQTLNVNQSVQAKVHRRRERLKNIRKRGL
jgi:amino acid adenylation domain-containing protein